MAKKIIITPKASQYLDDYFAYISEDNPEIALQFFDSTRLTIAQVARMPGIGSVFVTNNNRLQGLQKWSVKDFRKYLIFYIDLEDVVEIVRILYATRDISSILDPDLMLIDSLDDAHSVTGSNLFWLHPFVCPQPIDALALEFILTSLRYTLARILTQASDYLF
jgi:toxin ParE1/3/4